MYATFEKMFFRCFSTNGVKKKKDVLRTAGYSIFNPRTGITGRWVFCETSDAFWRLSVGTMVSRRLGFASFRLNDSVSRESVSENNTDLKFWLAKIPVFDFNNSTKKHYRHTS